MKINELSGDMFLSKQELIDAAISMAKAKTNMTAHEIYSDMCYILGPYYWGHDYSWKV